VELVCAVLFTAEYLLRIVVAEHKLRLIFRFYGLIDLAAILPFYLSLGIDLGSVRIFRLFCLFRILDLSKSDPLAWNAKCMVSRSVAVADAEPNGGLVGCGPIDTVFLKC